MNKILTITHELNKWFEINKRDLPFRKTVDPYAIWVSEVMLQQTQVKTVLPYYARFMERFPDVKSLAEAPMEDVLKLWEGLGYYRRVRYLKKGAETVMAQGGQMPTTRKEIEKIAGIGDYTAGAILSICYDLPEPAVDGNVVRVISRLYAIEEEGTALKKSCRDIVGMLLEHAKPSIFNQALMELGAMVCMPRNPRCEVCPVRDVCEALAEYKVNILPIKIQRNGVRKVYRAIYLIEDQKGRFLIRKRDDNGLLPGLWEFPGKDFKKSFDDVQALKGLHDLGIAYASIERIGEAKHVFSHLVWFMTLYHVKLEGSIHDDRVWADRDAIERLPFPSAIRASREFALKKSNNPRQYNQMVP